MNKLMILSVMALMLPIAPALACFPDSDSDADVILFAPALRGRDPISTSTSIEDCQANGLNPGSYFDDKGRIVGSPCDPVEYCSDTSSTDIAVVDYCSDTWNELEEQEQEEQEGGAEGEEEQVKSCPSFGYYCSPLEHRDNLEGEGNHQNDDEQVEESEAEDGRTVESESEASE